MASETPSRREPRSLLNSFAEHRRVCGDSRALRASAEPPGPQQRASRLPGTRRRRACLFFILRPPLLLAAAPGREAGGVPNPERREGERRGARESEAGPEKSVTPGKRKASAGASWLGAGNPLPPAAARAGGCPHAGASRRGVEVAPRPLLACPSPSGPRRVPTRSGGSSLMPPSPPLQTIKFLKSCRLEVGMKNNVKWELNNEIVARHFLKNVSGSGPEPAPRRLGALCRCRELRCASGAAGVACGGTDPGGRGGVSQPGFSSGLRGQRRARGQSGAQLRRVPSAAQRGFKALKGLREEGEEAGGEASGAGQPPWAARGPAALPSPRRGSREGAGAPGGLAAGCPAPGPRSHAPVPPFVPQLRVFVPPHALKLPEEPITRWGEYWCDVTVSERPCRPHPPPRRPLASSPPSPHPSPPPPGVRRWPPCSRQGNPEPSRRCPCSGAGWAAGSGGETLYLKTEITNKNPKPEPTPATWIAGSASSPAAIRPLSFPAPPGSGASSETASRSSESVSPPPAPWRRLPLPSLR